MAMKRDEKGRLVITKVIDGKEVVVYDCKKCGQSGLVTPSLLHKLGVIDVSIDALKPFLEKHDK